MRRVIAILVFSGLILLPAVPASADVTAEFGLGILTVSGDGDGNAIVLECTNGNVQVNDAGPTGGRVALLQRRVDPRAGRRWPPTASISPTSTARRSPSCSRSGCSARPATTR